MRLRSRGVVAEGMKAHFSYNLDQGMQEDQDFKVILYYTVCSRASCATGVSRSKENMVKCIGTEKQQCDS